MVKLDILAVVVACCALVEAHPGQSHESKKEELRVRNEYISELQHKDLAQCAGKLEKRGELDAITARRMETLKRLRQERGIPTDATHLKIKRQAPPPSPGPPGGGGLLSWFMPKPQDTAASKKNHKSNLTVSTNADWSMLGKGKTTVLAPDVTEGPYYVGGESIRKDIRDGESGISLTLDIQVIDMSNCQPVPKIAVEVWSCNSTGVYGGVLDGIGLMTMSNLLGGKIKEILKSNATKQIVDKKALRGVQITNDEGAVQFQTVIPGFYDGRTNHIHVATHTDINVQGNNTIAGGRTPHVGQLYFDQDLLDQIVLNEPYKSNKNPRMMNKDDFIMQQGSAGEADPFIEYVLIGKDISEGIFGWNNFGINTKKSIKMSQASTCGADGCKSSTLEWLKSWGII